MFLHTFVLHTVRFIMTVFTCKCTYRSRKRWLWAHPWSTHLAPKRRALLGKQCNKCNKCHKCNKCNKCHKCNTCYVTRVIHVLRGSLVYVNAKAVLHMLFLKHGCHNVLELLYHWRRGLHDTVILWQVIDARQWVYCGGSAGGGEQMQSRLRLKGMSGSCNLHRKSYPLQGGVLPVVLALYDERILIFKSYLIKTFRASRFISPWHQFVVMSWVISQVHMGSGYFPHSLLWYIKRRYPMLLARIATHFKKWLKCS